MKHICRFLVGAVLALALTATVGAQVLQTGEIAGFVKDAAGKPVSGAQITIVDTGQMDVTDANGYFATTSVLPGAHTVEAALVGYQPVRQENVVVTQELTTSVTLQLSQRQTIDSGVTRVVLPMVRKNVTPTLYTVTSKEEQLIRSHPSNLYQYPGAAATQPGIVPDSSGLPTVRGSRQYQVGYMLDGISIIQPATAEFATNLVTVGMDRMNVYTGGYRAELGSAVGGVINAVIKTGASMRGQAAVEASTGSWDYSALVYEQGDVEKNGFNWYVAGNFQRTRFENQPLAESAPAITDMVVKMIQPVGGKDRFTFLYTTGFQRNQIPVNDPFTGQRWGQNPTTANALNPDGSLNGAEAAHYLEFDDGAAAWTRTERTQDYILQSHHIGSLTWNRQFGPSASLSAQVYGWNRRKDLNAMSDFNAIDSKTDNSLAAGKLDYSSQMGQKLQLRVGGEWVYGWNWDRRVLLGESEKLGAPGSQYRVRDADTTDTNGYVSLTLKPSSRLTADLGVRYDARTYHRAISDEEIGYGRTNANPARDIQGADRKVLAATGRNPRYDAVTPRIGLAYALQPRTVLKASAGRYAQFAPASYLENRYLLLPDANGGGLEGWWASGQRKVFDVGPEKVDSLDVGIEHQFAPTMALAVTPYWRRSTDMFNQGTDYGPDGEPLAGTAFSNLGRGHTHGVETKLTLRENRGLSGWLTYTYQVARGNNTVGSAASKPTNLANPNAEYRLDYDQRHTIYLVGQYRRGRLEVNPMLELGSGYPWGGQIDANTGVRSAYAASPADGETPLPILVNGRIQPDAVNPFNTGWHHNLSVTFRLFNNDARSSYYFVQVQNLMNSKDVTARYWQNPVTGSSWFGYVPGDVTYLDESGASQTAPGHFEYKPWTVAPPIFVLAGLRQTF